jgi:hypothetical protein
MATTTTVTTPYPPLNPNIPSVNPFRPPQETLTHPTPSIPHRPLSYTPFPLSPGEPLDAPVRGPLPGPGAAAPRGGHHTGYGREERPLHPQAQRERAPLATQRHGK